MIADLQLSSIRTGNSDNHKNMESWVASSLFFDESNLECWDEGKLKVSGERKVEVDNCAEKTDFVYQSIPQPSPIPRQFPARLLSIRQKVFYNRLFENWFVAK